MNVTGQKVQCDLLQTFPIFPVSFCWGCVLHSVPSVCPGGISRRPGRGPPSSLASCVILGTALFLLNPYSVRCKIEAWTKLGALNLGPRGLLISGFHVAYYLYNNKYIGGE